MFWPLGQDNSWREAIPPVGPKCGLGRAHRSEERLIQAVGSQPALATVKLSPKNSDLIWDGRRFYEITSGGRAYLSESDSAAQSLVTETEAGLLGQRRSLVAFSTVCGRGDCGETVWRKCARLVRRGRDPR